MTIVTDRLVLRSHCVHIRPVGSSTSTVAKEVGMRKGTEPRRAGAILHLLTLTALGGAAVNSASAQVKPNPFLPPPARPANPVIDAVQPTPSKVFPEGGFPDTPKVPEGAIPAS